MRIFLGGCVRRYIIADVAPEILGKVGQRKRQEMQVVKSRYCKEWEAGGFTSSLSVVKPQTMCALKIDGRHNVKVENVW